MWVLFHLVVILHLYGPEWTMLYSFKYRLALGAEV
jgi:hypothetical protein